MIRPHAALAFALLFLAISGSIDASADNPSTPLRNVDVTVVMPLPAPADVDALLRPDDAGERGALLPASVFGASIPELDHRDPLSDDSARLHALRVLAVRFDPCPGVTMPPRDRASCQPDVRLVFQSLRSEGAGVVARDGAVHAFYRLSPSDFAGVVAELRAVRAEHATDPDGPLDVNPILAREGLSGPYAKRLRGLVLRAAGASNLVRVTHFRRTKTDSTPQVIEWSFAIREKATDGAWSDSKVATTTVTEQTAATIVGGRWDAIITPEVTHADDPTRVFRVATQSDRQQAFDADVRVLNPRIHSSESVDCATCHVVPEVAGFAHATLGLAVDAYPDRFQSRFGVAAASLTDLEAVAFDHIHMLSYLGTKLSVTPRVANETAAVLEFFAAP
jgi:hypothetical protein